MTLRCIEEFFAVRREESLVRGDDRLAQTQRGEDCLARDGGSAHQFDHQIHLGIVDDGCPIRGEQRTPNRDGAFLLQVTHRHPGDAQADAEARCHQGAIAGDGLIHTAANRPATDDSQVHLPHKRGHRLQIIAVRDNFFLETNEITEAGETRRVRGKWKWIAPQTESGANEVGSFAPASIQGLAWQ